MSSFENDPHAPETSQLTGELIKKLDQYGCKIEGGGQYNRIFEAIYKLVKEKDEAKATKEEYFNLWNPIDEVVRNLPDIKVGDSISEKAKEMILQHPALLEAFQTNHFALKTIVNNHGENIHPTIKTKAEVLLKMNEISLKKIRKVEVLNKPEDKRYFIVFFIGHSTEGKQISGTASICTSNNEYINSDSVLILLKRDNRVEGITITGINEVNEFDFKTWGEPKA